MTRWTMKREQVIFEHRQPLHMREDDYRELMNSLSFFFDDTKAHNAEKKDTHFNPRLFNLPQTTLRQQSLKHGIRKVGFAIEWLEVGGPCLVVEFTTALVYKKLVVYGLH